MKKFIIFPLLFILIISFVNAEVSANTKYLKLDLDISGEQEISEAALDENWLILKIDSRFNSGIYSYSLNTRKLERISQQNGWIPRIDFPYVVWKGSDKEVVIYNLLSKEYKEIDNADNPDVSGNKIAYVKDDGLWIYYIVNESSYLINQGAFYSAEIEGNFVAGSYSEGDSNSGKKVYVKDLVFGAEKWLEDPFGYRIEYFSDNILLLNQFTQWGSLYTYNTATKQLDFLIDKQPNEGFYWTGTTINFDRTIIPLGNIQNKFAYGYMNNKIMIPISTGLSVAANWNSFVLPRYRGLLLIYKGNSEDKNAIYFFPNIFPGVGKIGECGNNICETEEWETISNCPEDCFSLDCRETDGGKNLKIKGSVTGVQFHLDDDSITENQDQCTTVDPFRIHEHFCDADNRHKFTITDCSKGTKCFDGACLDTFYIVTSDDFSDDALVEALKDSLEEKDKKYEIIKQSDQRKNEIPSFVFIDETCQNIIKNNNIKTSFCLEDSNFPKHISLIAQDDNYIYLGGKSKEASLYSIEVLKNNLNDDFIQRINNDNIICFENVNSEPMFSSCDNILL